MSTIAAGFIGTIEVGNIGTVAAGNIGTIAETGDTRPRNATTGCSHMCQAILPPVRKLIECLISVNHDKGILQD